ncbi:MAG: metal ABC transporter ATP-binding protein [Thiovulaceae bacterium]|nr:metal ABC transporter ATP-binding protein [Sulfurimonadaceae bacterium]
MRFALPIFDVASLSLQINSQVILDSLSLKIFSGEYDAIIGPNGGGKTTLIRLLLGLEKPTSGTIKIFGKNIDEFKEWHKIGYVPQRASHVDAAFPATVLDVVKMGRTAKRGFFARYSAEDAACVEDAMKKMDVIDIKNKMVGTLSGGQRQRVMIARALASKPEVLILDEPNTGVDVASQQRFYELLRKLNRDEKLTIVFITHDIGVIADDIQRLFTINRKLLTCNNPKEAISCEDMSRLYGVDAHLLSNHHHHH